MPKMSTNLRYITIALLFIGLLIILYAAVSSVPAKSNGTDVASRTDALNNQNFKAVPSSPNVNVCPLKVQRRDHPAAEASEGKEELLIICLGDSITYGNRSHLTARSIRTTARLEGSYPAELEKIIREHFTNSRSVRQSVQVYAFAVCGFMVKPNQGRLSFGASPEYSNARDLIQRATAVVKYRNGAVGLAYSIEQLDQNVGRVDVRCSMQLPNKHGGRDSLTAVGSHKRRPEARNERDSSGGCEGFSDKNISLKYSQVPLNTKRTVLVLSMLGTNDGMSGVWTNQADYIKEYTQLIHGLIPDEYYSKGSEKNVALGEQNNILNLSIGLITPIPAYPDPQGTDFNQLVYGLSGQLIATSIRQGVWRVASQLRESFGYLESVGVLDLYVSFTKVVIASALHSQSREDVESILSALVIAMPAPEAIYSHDLHRIPPPLMNERSYVTYVQEHMSPGQVAPYLRDGVHPTRKGHYTMARLIADHLKC